MTAVRRVHPKGWTRVLFIALGLLACGGLLHQTIVSQGDSPDVKLVTQLYDAYRQIATLLLIGGGLFAMGGLLMAGYGEKVTLTSQGVTLLSAIGPLVLGKESRGWGDYPKVMARPQKAYTLTADMGGLGSRFRTRPGGPVAYLVLAHRSQNPRFDIPLAVIPAQGPEHDAALARWSKLLSRPIS